MGIIASGHFCGMSVQPWQTIKVLRSVKQLRCVDMLFNVCYSGNIQPKIAYLSYQVNVLNISTLPHPGPMPLKYMSTKYLQNLFCHPESKATPLVLLVVIRSHVLRILVLFAHFALWDYSSLLSRLSELQSSLPSATEAKHAAFDAKTSWQMIEMPGNLPETHPNGEVTCESLVDPWLLDQLRPRLGTQHDHGGVCSSRPQKIDEI